MGFDEKGQQEQVQQGKSHTKKMHVDPVESLLQVDAGEKTVCPSENQFLNQAMQKYKGPLLDCTNRMHPAAENGKKDVTHSKKGQWKIRDRMLCSGQVEGVSTLHSEVDDEKIK